MSQVEAAVPSLVPSSFCAVSSHLIFGEVQRQGFHRFATGTATDADVGQHDIGQGVDDEWHQLTAAFGGVTADGDFGFGDRFAGAAIFVEGWRRTVDEFGQGELADVRLAGGPLRVADVVGHLHGHVVAVGHDFDLVLVTLEQAIAFDVAAEVENDCIHRMKLLKVIVLDKQGESRRVGRREAGQAATGGGRVATRRIDAVSSSSWKCGRRNTVAL